MPNYQMPGHSEISNPNDAFGKRNAVQERMLNRHKANTLSNAGASVFEAPKLTSAAEKFDSFIKN